MMTSRLVLSAIALATSAATSYAGPCSEAIDRVQVRIDARLSAAAGAGPTAVESSAATRHLQPTPESIAAAEQRLGDLSEGEVRAIKAAIERAREADRAGDRDGCEKALAEAQSALGP